MKTARMTVLMKPTEKSEIEAEAARLGVSSGEYIRLAVDNFVNMSSDQEAELEALSRELEEALPRMRADLEAMRQSIAEARATIAAYRREKLVSGQSVQEAA